MEKISLGFILNATGGRLEHECFNLKITCVCTDTRAIKPGCLFVALKGENFDGHDYIAKAFESGALAAVSERSPQSLSISDNYPVIIVKDTRSALLRLAQAYRMMFDIPVTGITGSVGKTSTKETVCAVLSKKYKTHKNEGNRNNEIGMPMSVFGLDRTHEAAVFEMGMSGFGEISRLTRVAQPDIGIITNIGISHIEKLGSRENILKAKLEIIDGMKAGGHLILNGDDPLLSNFAHETGDDFPLKITTYGINSQEGVYASGIVRHAYDSEFDIHFNGERIHARMPVPGEHNIYNALAAFCTGLALKVSPKAIVDGLLNYRPTGMRQKISNIGGVTFIEDCYNASPDSMNSAFDVLKTVKNGRSIAVLADMLELGAASREAHLEVGRAAASNGVDILLCCGNDAKYCCEGFNKQNKGLEPDAYINSKDSAIPLYKKNSMFFEDKDSLVLGLAALLKEGDTVLFKGSRGMKLEEVAQAIYEGWKNI